MLLLPASLISTFLCLASLLAHVTPAAAQGGFPSGICSIDRAAPKPHRSTRCGFQGELQSPGPLLDTLNDVSYLYCRSTCIHRGDGCKAYSFNFNTRTCLLYTLKIVKQKPLRSQSGTYFWNRLCFTTSACPSNLLRDSGFELGTLRTDEIDAPWFTLTPTRPNDAAIAPPGETSSFALSFVPDSLAFIAQDLQSSLAEESALTISYNAPQPNGDADLQAYVSLRGADDNSIQQWSFMPNRVVGDGKDAYGTVPGEWGTHTFYFPAFDASDPATRVYFLSQAGPFPPFSSLLLDNAFLRPTGNLLKDGLFLHGGFYSSPTSDGWYTTQGAPGLSTSTEDRYRSGIDYAAAFDTDGQLQTIQNDLATPHAGPINVSFSYRIISADTDLTMTIGALQSSNGDKTITFGKQAGESTDTFGNPVGHWARRSFVITPAPDESFVSALIQVLASDQNNNGDTAVLVDNVIFAPAQQQAQ